MEFTETRRLYQQLAAELKRRIEAGVYPVGDKLPAERYISEEMNVSRTVVREAIIMLEVEGYVEVRKGSGIHVMSNQQKHLVTNQGIEFDTAGPFELLQARQLIESNIAEFAATQVTRQDIVQLIEIQNMRVRKIASVTLNGILNSTYKSLSPPKIQRWQPLSKRCGASARIILTGLNCMSTSMMSRSKVGAKITTRSLKR